MTKSRYPQSIPDAAKLLDEAKPDWFKLVKPDEIDMGSFTKCILGQIYGTYCTGMYELFGNPSPAENIYIDTIFGSKASVEEWTKEINQRLAPKNMTAIEMLQLLKAGKKVRRTSWIPGKYIERKNRSIVYQTGAECGYNLDMILSDVGEWEEYTVQRVRLETLSAGQKYSLLEDTSRVYTRTNLLDLNDSDTILSTYTKDNKTYIAYHNNDYLVIEVK